MLRSLIEDVGRDVNLFYSILLDAMILDLQEGSSTAATVSRDQADGEYWPVSNNSWSMQRI